MTTRADDDFEYFTDTHGNGLTIGTAGALGPEKLPRGWKAPKREFPPGFHVAAPGPSHPEAEAVAPRKPRAPRKVKP